MAGIHPDEIPVENRVEQSAPGNVQSSRDKQSHFDMAKDNDHEPTEGYRGVHVAKQWFPLPYLYMEKTVAEEFLDVLGRSLRDEEGLPELYPVFPGHGGKKPYGTDPNPAEHECNADGER